MNNCNKKGKQNYTEKQKYRNNIVKDILQKYFILSFHKKSTNSRRPVVSLR